MEVAKRFQTNENAVVEFYNKPGAMTASLVNMSSTGACLQWHYPEGDFLEKGALIKITIMLGSLKKSHYLTAEVVWNKRGRLGICFVKPSELMSKVIRRF
jgi:hypothetical protein